eukprot:scaffold2884_cov363-Pavlova_lutheri.AAC.1
MERMPGPPHTSLDGVTSAITTFHVPPASVLPWIPSVLPSPPPSASAHTPRSDLEASLDRIKVGHPRDVPAARDRGRLLEHGERGLLNVRGRDLLDSLHEFRGGFPVAVGQDLSSDVLRHHHLGFQVHVHAGNEGQLGPLQLRVGDRSLLGQCQHLVTYGTHGLIGLVRLGGDVDAHQPRVVEERGEERAVLHPGVLVEDPRVQPGIHALAGSARAEGTTATHQHLQQGGHHGRLEIAPSSGSLESQHHVHHVPPGAPAVISADVLGGQCGGSWGRRPSGQDRFSDGQERALGDPGGRQHHARSGVEFVDVFHAIFRGQVLHGILDGHQRHAQSTRVSGLMERFHEEALVIFLGLLDLFFDAFHLFLDFPGLELRVDDGVDEHFCHFRQVVPGSIDGVGHLFPGGVGQQVGSHGFHFPHQSEVRPVGGGTERHAFQEVRHAAVGSAFVHAPCVHVQSERGCRSLHRSRGLFFTRVSPLPSPASRLSAHLPSFHPHLRVFGGHARSVFQHVHVGFRRFVGRFHRVRSGVWHGEGFPQGHRQRVGPSPGQPRGRGGRGHVLPATDRRWRCGMRWNGCANRTCRWVWRDDPGVKGGFERKG